MDLSDLGIQNKQLIPDRDPNMMTGSQFAQLHLQSDRTTREKAALDEILSGNIPDFLRNFCPVTVSDNNNSITYLVMPDYISIGNDDDYFRYNLQAPTAQVIADKWDFTLPTKKIVDDIYKQAVNKLEAIPHGPPYNEEMLSMTRFIWSNDQINNQMKNLNKNDLTAGHRKDYVLCNSLAPNNPKQRVAIYGFFQKNGVPIQGPQPNASSHEQNYSDYSQGPRFICKDVIVNGNLMRIDGVFSDISLSKLINEDGILKFTRY